MASSPKKVKAKSIGHYVLGKTIGEGTFGKVKLGTHILTGEKVAVKILEKERIVDVADVERVAREIHILKLIQHPHVIRLFEIIETPRQLYLITEYCSGGELFDHIVASGRVREREACRFFHQIMSGVEHIHKQNVVHRDLKPENLLLDDHRNIKIVDFGLSNTYQDGQLLKTACGSPCYAAPEMIAGHSYVPSRCDIWSCGVILFALVCGYLPFEDQNTANLYRKILNADYETPKFISDSVRDLISRMLTTDPEHRCTIDEIRCHSWYKLVQESAMQSDIDRTEKRLEEDVLEQLDRFGFPRDYAERCLQMNKHNHVTTTYYLLVDKKRRMSDRMNGETQPAPIAAGDLSGGVTGAGDFSGGGRASAAGAPASSSMAAPSVAAAAGTASCVSEVAHMKTGVDVVPCNQAADADRAGGSSVTPPYQTRPPRTPEPSKHIHNSQWAQVRPATTEPSSARCDTPGSRRSGAAVVAPLSARSIAKYPSGSGTQPSPRKRAPLQQANGIATPRGPVPSPLPSQTVTPSRPTGSTTARSQNEARRRHFSGSSVETPATGTTSGVTGTFGGTSSARSANRPASPSGHVGRPSGSAAARNTSCQSDTRRRQNTGRSPSETPTPTPSANGVGSGAGVGSARGSSRPMSPSGQPSRVVRPPGSGVVRRSGQAAVGDLGVGSLVSRGSATVGCRRPVGTQRPQLGGSVRATSASPDVHTGGNHEGGTISSRESNHEAMRTCRGAFNVSCTSSKAPKELVQEMYRSLQMNNVTFKQGSPYLVRCQRLSVRFEMEISNLDNLDSMHVVRFRRVAGELSSYKELCARVLAEMKM